MPPTQTKDPIAPIALDDRPVDPLRAAELSGDLDRMKAAADIRASRAQERKANSDAANAEAQFPELTRKRRFYERLLSTAQGTAALALVTIVFQIIQFGYTARENRLATEDAQWKDVVKGISFDPDARSVASVTNLATFYRSPRYAANAKALAAAILPAIPNHDAFDRAFVNLATETQPGEEINLYTVARAVTDRYLTDIDHARDKFGDSIPSSPNQKLSDFLLAKEDDLAEKDAGAESLNEIAAAIADARLREWEIDSYTTFIRGYWKAHGTKPKLSLLARLDQSAEPYTAELQKILFRQDDNQPIDLRGLDFSYASLTGSSLIRAELARANLNSANLNEVTLTGSDFTGVTRFEGSTWRNADWWNALNLPNELCAYLSNKYPAPPGNAATAAQTCTR